MMMRKIGSVSNPTVEISINDDAWLIKTYTTFRSVLLNFKLGETFDEVTADGRNVKVGVGWRHSWQLLPDMKTHEGNRTLSALPKLPRLPGGRSGGIRSSLANHDKRHLWNRNQMFVLPLAGLTQNADKHEYKNVPSLCLLWYLTYYIDMSHCIKQIQLILLHFM